MPNNMDLNTFYQHALQWKHQQEEAERMAIEEYAENIRSQWVRVAEMIRDALPIQGMTIHETEAGQFEKYPMQGRLIDLDCCLDPLVKDHISHSEGNLMKGVIRVRVYWDSEVTEPGWKILKYVVRVDGKSTEFETSYEAFLAVYPVMQVRAD